VKYKTFEEMPVWKKGMGLAEQVYLLTGDLPTREDYGLTSQMRRSALSVSGNLAEGFGRHHMKDKLNFYYASRGSLAETKSHLIYGQRVGYFKAPDCERLFGLITELWRELNSLIRVLQINAQPKP
jgi:four helix bundle protein